MAGLALKHQQALLVRSRGDIQKAMYAKVAVGGGAAVKTPFSAEDDAAVLEWSKKLSLIHI